MRSWSRLTRNPILIVLLSFRSVIWTSDWNLTLSSSLQPHARDFIIISLRLLALILCSNCSNNPARLLSSIGRHRQTTFCNPEHPLTHHTHTTTTISLVSCNLLLSSKVHASFITSWLDSSYEYFTSCTLSHCHYNLPTFVATNTN